MYIYLTERLFFETACYQIDAFLKDSILEAILEAILDCIVGYGFLVFKKSGGKIEQKLLEIPSRFEIAIRDSFEIRDCY